MYRHYKGELYELVGSAIDAETGEECVIYKKDDVYVRRESDFFAELSPELQEKYGQKCRFEEVLMVHIQNSEFVNTISFCHKDPIPRLTDDDVLQALLADRILSYIKEYLREGKKELNVYLPGLIRVLTEK